MKIGIVGYGSIGQRHAANLLQLGHTVVIYDPLGPRDVKLECDLYDSDVEAVIVATPTPFHEGPLRACIERGKHVLIEKPISVSIGTLPALLQAADDKGLVVMMGNNLRFHPCVDQCRRWLKEGLIGNVIWANFICAQANSKYTESVTLNWGAHEVDMALHLFGPVKRVACASADPTGKIVDFVLIHQNLIRSSFHLDYVTPIEIREAWIAGETNNISIEFLKRQIGVGKWAQGMGGSYDDDYLAEAKAFVERIGNRLTLGATGWNGLETLKVLLDVETKARDEVNQISEKLS